MGYINSRNDSFSSVPEGNLVERALQGAVDRTKGQFGKYKDRIFNPLTYTRDLENARDTEGHVFINGRRIPGIFGGFKIGGGVIVEKFDQKKYRDKLVDLPKGAQLFQLDKGVRPVSGTASFVLLDDIHSTALAKSKDFVRIVTHWEDGEDAQLNIKRVFKIKSFLIGIDRAFNFSTIKIPDYSLDMSNRMEGRIDCGFQFEQFEIFTDEFRTRRPLTGMIGDDAGKQLEDLETLDNPFTAGIEIGIG